jgi:signal transduction histidine kinase
VGLAIVHKIVTSHGGQIQVDNRPGDGATFIVTFPIAG